MQQAHAIGLHVVEIFDWHDDPTGRGFRFNVSGIQQALTTRPDIQKPESVDVTRELYDHAMNNGVDLCRLIRMDKEPFEPVLMVQWHNEEFVLIDGNHRVARRWIFGPRVIDAIMVPFGLWHRHCVPR